MPVVHHVKGAVHPDADLVAPDGERGVGSEVVGVFFDDEDLLGDELGEDLRCDPETFKGEEYDDLVHFSDCLNINGLRHSIGLVVDADIGF